MRSQRCHGIGVCSLSGGAPPYGTSVASGAVVAPLRGLPGPLGGAAVEGWSTGR